MSLTSVANAAQLPDAEPAVDSLEISLLTCGPGTEVYSLYGHTAIRVHSLDTGMDWVVNYGLFSFRTDYFVLKFTLGIMDYEMGIMGMDDFMREYTEERRWVKEQVLNLSDAEKRRILAAIKTNYLPENRKYRYNYFYDNCTTRARDILLQNLLGRRVEYTNYESTNPSFRQLIHEWNTDYPWARWGNDVLLGVAADNPTTFAQQQFLPSNLMKDFDHAFVVGPNKRQPLVKQSRWLIAPFNDVAKAELPDSPSYFAWIMLIHALVFTVVELFTKKDFKIFDALMMLNVGVAGLILFFMIFSAHPTVRVNLQLLLLNPVALVGIYFVLRKRMSATKVHVFGFLLICLLLFFLGNLWQSYAEGMNVLALCLLLRYGKRSYLLMKAQIESHE